MKTFLTALLLTLGAMALTGYADAQDRYTPHWHGEGWDTHNQDLHQKGAFIEHWWLERYFHAKRNCSKFGGDNQRTCLERIMVQHWLNDAEIRDKS
jgi:hypothetical protein